MELHESSLSSFRYCEGYPERYLTARRSNIRWAIGCFGPFLCASIVGLFFAAYGFNAASRFAATLRLVELFLFACYFGHLLWDGVCVARRTCIVPYFQQTLEDIHTFAQGEAIAKHCQELDAMSLELGVSPLSTFGFNDDFYGEELVWHPADKGLATVTRLIQALRASDPLKLSDQDQVISELVAIENALRKASEQSVMFCLLLRTSGVTNAIEWEQRKGSCF